MSEVAAFQACSGVKKLRNRTHPALIFLHRTARKISAGFNSHCDFSCATMAWKNHVFIEGGAYE